jgi:hypothetical protein
MVQGWEEFPVMDATSLRKEQKSQEELISRPRFLYFVVNSWDV